MSERLDDQGHGDKPGEALLIERVTAFVKTYERTPDFGTVHAVLSADDAYALAKVFLSARSAGTRIPTSGAYRWIEDASKLLLRWRASVLQPEGELASMAEATDTLLSGVPTPQVDLGFNSPADRAAQSATEPMMVGGFCTDRERCVADRNLLARAYAFCQMSMGPEGMDIATDIAATLKQPHEMILDRAINATTDRNAKP